MKNTLIKKGEVLFKLNPGRYQARVDRLKADLESGVEGGVQRFEIGVVDLHDWFFQGLLAQAPTRTQTPRVSTSTTTPALQVPVFFTV